MMLLAARFPKMKAKYRFKAHRQLAVFFMTFFTYKTLSLTIKPLLNEKFSNNNTCFLFHTNAVLLYFDSDG